MTDSRVRRRLRALCDVAGGSGEATEAGAVADRRREALEAIDDLVVLDVIGKKHVRNGPNMFRKGLRTVA